MKRLMQGSMWFVFVVSGYCALLNLFFGSTALDPWQKGLLIGFEPSSYMLVAISAGFCEETIFRGYMMNGLKRAGQPAWLAMALSSLSFIFFHGLLPWPMMVAGFVISMIWSALFHWTGILWVTIYFHALWDASVTLIPWSSL